MTDTSQAQALKAPRSARLPARRKHTRGSQTRTVCGTCKGCCIGPARKRQQYPTCSACGGTGQTALPRETARVGFRGAAEPPRNPRTKQ